MGLESIYASPLWILKLKGLIRHRLYTKLLIVSTYMNFFTDIFALENVGFADILAVFIR